MKYGHVVLAAVIVGALVALSPVYVPALEHVRSPQVAQQSQPAVSGGAQNMSYVKEGGSINDTALAKEVKSLPGGQLSEAEKKDLLYIREEEKLARDVYLTLYEKWGLRVFANIAKSEQTHMDAVKLLLDKYGLPDPAAGKGVGEFTNPEIQELYRKLVDEGSKSLVDALKVGAFIEEKDIIDLQKAINSTDKQDIKLVLENLMMGSRNHLRAFVKNLEAQGVTYTPQLLPLDEYEKIISSPMERGGAGGRGPHGQGHGPGWVAPRPIARLAAENQLFLSVNFFD